MAYIRNAQEWYEQNMHTDYPLVGTSEERVGRATTKTADAASLYLPKSFLVDIQLNVENATDDDAAERFFISSVSKVGDNYVSVEIAYKSPTGTVSPCARSAAIPLSLRIGDSLSARTISITPVSTHSGDLLTERLWLRNITGRLVVGTCIDMYNVGVLSFTYDATAIISARVLCYETEDSRITVTDSSGITHDMSGDIYLEAGDGIDIRVNGNTVIISTATADAEESVQYSSVEEVVNAIKKELGNPIYTINGVRPDDTGNFTLEGGDCVQVTSTGESGLVLSNTCSKPCCSDATTTSELAVSMETMDAAIDRLNNYYQALTASVSALQSRLASLIASRS